MDKTNIIQVLLVEDEAGHATLVKLKLGRAQSGRFNVTWAQSLNEARQCLSVSTFNVILLDLSLPDSTGLTTIHNTRAMAIDVPIVVLSGRSDTDFALTALEAGAIDYMFKDDFGYDGLARVIRYAILRTEMEARNKLLIAALEAAANGIVITDKDASVIWVNSAFAQLTGFSPEEAVGNKAGELIQSGLQNNAFYQDMWTELLSDQQWRGELINKRKDGSLYHEKLSIAPMKNGLGEITHFIGIKEDITERKDLENRLRDSDAFNISILNSLTTQIIVLDDKGVIVAINNAWHRFTKDNHLNLSSRSLLGLHYSEAGEIMPYGHEATTAYKGIATVLAGDQETFHLEFLRYYSSGQQYWFRMNVSPLQGSRRGVVISHENITDYKQQQEILQQAKETAERSLTEQRQFIAMVSHEFRSPLAVIDYATQLLVVKLRTETTVTPILERIQRGVSRLSNFLENCLTEDRLDSEGLFLQASVIDIHRLAASIKESIQLISDSHQISVELDQNMPELNADPQLLRILLLNLLGNAVKYSPPKSQIQLRISHNDLTYIFEVTDHGQGIPADELPLIFQKYMRGRSIIGVAGAGLGLALVKRIVELHKGNIEVYSQVNVGTAIKVTFPLE